MSVPNNGGPAFPQALTFDPAGEARTPGMYFANAEGMTLRDYFAANENIAEYDFPEAGIPMSVAESLAGPIPDGAWVKNPLETMKWEARWRAAIRYIRADAMIAAREGGSK